MSEIRKLPELADLSPEQQDVVRYWDSGLAVLAGAGSGKTTTMVIKCVELLKLKPEARFVAVSFTERSASDLREKLSLRFLAAPNLGSLRQHWVTTIHGLCATLIREFPRAAGLDGEESLLSEAEMQLYWERAVEALWFDEIPALVQSAVDLLLERESREGLMELLARMRTLESIGLGEFFGEGADPALCALRTVASFVHERYERQKRRQGVLDFDDLEKGADRVLADPEVRAILHKRFELVLVDEFQDTNVIQARIISQFVRPDYSNLCVVGDPKQSIYRFRDADVTVFEEFCQKLPAQKVLTRNYRSRAGVIDYVNQVCAPLFEASEMRYDPLVPQREAGSEDAVIRLDIGEPSQLAEWIRGEVERGIPLHEMALLVRRIRGNEKWFKALTSQGIPIAMGSGGLFWEDPRVRELVCFLKWWSNPGNAFSGAVFLRAPWVGVADQDLDEWIKQDPSLTSAFFASGHPLARALQTFRAVPVSMVRPGELLMALLVDDKIEAELGGPLLGLWHRVEELSSGGLDFHSIVTELGAALQESRRERDVPPPRNQGQLAVLTIHGSKGLEFPHVILIDLGKKLRAPGAPLLFWDRHQGVYLGGRTEDGSRDKDDPVEKKWRLEESRKSLAESKRVFYVAMTRARERLVLVCPELSEKDSNIDPETVFDQDFWRGWIETSGKGIPSLTARIPSHPKSNQSHLSSSKERRNERVPSQVAMRRARHSVTEWSVLSRCPRAYDWTFIKPVTPPSAEAPDELRKPRSTQVDQRELGTRVHACLEKSDWDGLRALEKEVGPQRLRAESIIDWAKKAPDMGARSSGLDVWTELAFEVPCEDEVLVGSLDRLVWNERTRDFSIIDFKVTAGRKTHEDLIESYQPQLELYAYALNCLEPSRAPGKVSAQLVAISPGGVDSIQVPLAGIDVVGLADEAGRIIQGEMGRATSGRVCRTCQFKKLCPDAQGEQAQAH